MKIKYVVFALMTVIATESCTTQMSSNKRVDQRKKKLAKKRKKHPTDCPKLDCD